MVMIVVSSYAAWPLRGEPGARSAPLWPTGLPGSGAPLPALGGVGRARQGNPGDKALSGTGPELGQLVAGFVHVGSWRASGGLTTVSLGGRCRVGPDPTSAHSPGGLFLPLL